MRLYMQCSHCHHRFYTYGVSVESRITFAQQIHSKHIDLLCARCGTLKTHSVNDVYAEGSASILGPVVLVIGLFSTIFIGAIGYFIGGLAAVLINAVCESAEATQVRKFNTSVIM